MRTPPRSQDPGSDRCGHGRRNRFVVPRRGDLAFFERVRGVRIRRQVGASPLTFLVEPPRADAFHACTVDDVCRVLEFLPPGHLSGLELVVLRQPTRKQELLRGVWGRWASFRRMGPAVFLDAQALQPLRRPRALSVEGAAELERLRASGFEVRSDRRWHVIHPTPLAVRESQLFRTLLHEVGHHVDWLERVDRPAIDAADHRRRVEDWRRRPRRECEEFAHRFAAEHAPLVPRFPPLVDHAGLLADGLEPEWFLTPRRLASLG